MSFTPTSRWDSKEQRGQETPQGHTAQGSSPAVPKTTLQALDRSVSSRTIRPLGGSYLPPSWGVGGRADAGAVSAGGTRGHLPREGRVGRPLAELGMRRSCLTLEVPRPRQMVRAGRGVPWGLLVVGVAPGRGPGGPASSGLQEGPPLLPCPAPRSCPAFLFPFSCLSAPSRPARSPQGEPADLGRGKVAPLGFRSRGCGAVHTQQGPWDSPRWVVAREHTRELRGGLEGSEGLAPG